MLRSCLVALTATIATSCTLTLDGDPKGDAGVDGRLTLKGRVCAEPQGPAAAYPTKIVFLMDQSGSMCVTDGPGAQGTAGFCEAVGDQLAAQGIAVPGRVKALKTLLQEFAARPEVSVAIVPWDTQVRSPYPAIGFAPATDAALVARVEALQSSLGKGTDYQSALAEAKARIEQDMKQVLAAGRREELARTRYVTVFVTDGLPYPRCVSNDSLSDWASGAAPDGIWPDSPSGFCNTAPEGAPDAGVVYSSEIPDFPIGGDRNQNGQIFDGVIEIASLKQAYGAGEVRVDAVQLFNSDELALCGALCVNDIFALPGGTVDDARYVINWTLQKMAQVGGGEFRQFTDPQKMDFGTFDLTSLASTNTVAQILMRRWNGETTPEGYPDFPGPERPISPDQDGDGFPDTFEAAHVSAGFDPSVPDEHGCSGACTDADGDGLSSALEAYLGTDPARPDTDGDSMPDGVELETGLDPVAPNLGDSDGDGARDLLEVAQGLNPVRPDVASWTDEKKVGYEGSTFFVDGRTCYDFVVSNVSLGPTGFQGRSYFTLAIAEAPEKLAFTMPYAAGRWRQACVFASAPPSGASLPEVVLEDDDFVPMSRFGAAVGQVLPSDYETICRTVEPQP